MPGCFKPRALVYTQDHIALLEGVDVSELIHSPNSDVCATINRTWTLWLALDPIGNWRQYVVHGSTCASARGRRGRGRRIEARGRGIKREGERGKDREGRERDRKRG